MLIFVVAVHLRLITFRLMRKLFGASTATLALIAGTIVVASPATAAEHTFGSIDVVDPTVIGNSTATETIEVSGVESYGDLRVDLGFLKSNTDSCVVDPAGVPSLNHQIGFDLTSPMGTTITLIQQRGASETESYPNPSAPTPVVVTLEDSAEQAVGVSGSPETGIFAPVESPDVFAGENLNGDWTLTAKNRNNNQVLCFGGAILTFTDAVEPTITLSATPNPVRVGDPVTLTAHVTDPGTATQVGFYTDMDFLGDLVAIEDGVATLVYTELPVGTHIIRATLEGMVESDPVTVIVAASLPGDPDAPTPPERVETAAA